MQAIEFPQQNDILAKNQPEYLPLPVFIKAESVDWKDADGVEHTTMVPAEMTCCFQLSQEEIAQVIATGQLWYTQCVYGNQFQPVRMSMVNPFANDTVLPDKFAEKMAWMIRNIFTHGLVGSHAEKKIAFNSLIKELEGHISM